MMSDNMRFVPMRLLYAAMYPRKMPWSRASCMVRATSHAAEVEAPMVTIGIEPMNQAIDSIAKSPMVLIATLYGLS